jgi:hypothetical protein
MNGSEKCTGNNAKGIRPSKMVKEGKKVKFSLCLTN